MDYWNSIQNLILNKKIGCIINLIKNAKNSKNEFFWLNVPKFFNEWIATTNWFFTILMKHESHNINMKKISSETGFKHGKYQNWTCHPVQDEILYGLNV